MVTERGKDVSAIAHLNAPGFSHFLKPLIHPLDRDRINPSIDVSYVVGELLDKFGAYLSK